MKGIVIKHVKSRKDLKKFIYLPEKVHKDNAIWMPPLFSDEWVLLDPKKNKSFSYCDYIQLLAYRDSEPVGRIMGLINRKYNQIKGEQAARAAR